ncbi:MAG TPA: glycoside hydrolase family 104 protein [Acidobacteriaceae bacterium]|jgi:muramidase (phage lysozyme)
MAELQPTDAGSNIYLPPFLDLVAWSEGTSRNPATKNDGYDVIVTSHTGIPEIFTDYTDHPFDQGRAPVLVRAGSAGGRPLYSDAAGRYQEMLKIWRAYRSQLNLPDFSPRSQDLIARQLISDCNALHLIAGGEIGAAITACSKEWASFPGNSYGQGNNSMDALLAKYAELKG